jgi:hypothetical protein
MVSKRVSLLAAALLVLLTAGESRAEDKLYDLKLERFWTREATYEPANNADYGGVEYKRVSAHWKRADQEQFDNLMGDIGSALAPRFLGPGASTGMLGFQFGVNFSFTNIPENSDHWKTVMTSQQEKLYKDKDYPDGTNVADSDIRQVVALEPGKTMTRPDSYLSTWQLYVRKGLPFSLELGGSVTGLMKSSLVGVGMELKWAPLEGYRNAPEIALRGALSTFLGTQDYSLLVASGDLMISKEIGIAGLFQLSPYIGYEFLYIHGSCNVVPTVYNARPKDKNTDQYVDYYKTAQEDPFEAANVFHHYIVMGLQAIITVVNVGFDFSLNPADTQNHSFSLRLGLDF